MAFASRQAAEPTRKIQTGIQADGRRRHIICCGANLDVGLHRGYSLLDEFL